MQLMIRVDSHDYSITGMMKLEVDNPELVGVLIQEGDIDLVYSLSEYCNLIFQRGYSQEQKIVKCPSCESQDIGDDGKSYCNRCLKDINAKRKPRTWEDVGIPPRLRNTTEEK